MYRIGWIINPFRKHRHCCTEQRRFVGGICGTWCVHGSGSGRDRWPRPALPRVSGSTAIPCTRWKPEFGQKGAFISTRLSLHLRMKNTGKTGRQGCGSHSLKGAGCYLSPSSLLNGLGGTWGWGADSYKTLLIHFSGRGKHRNAASHETNSHYFQVRDFGTTCIFLRGKGWVVPALSCSLRARGTSLSPL